MIRHALIVASISAVLCTVALGGEPLPGVPVFRDDFSVSALFVENWNVTKDTRCEGGRAVIPVNNNLTLRRAVAGDFAVTADMIVDKPKGTDLGHCGLILDGIHFMITPITPLRAHTAYRVPGEKRSRGKAVKRVPGLEFGKPSRITVTRVRLGQGYKYCYTVNGCPVDAFQVAMPITDKISFYGYKTSLAVDNVCLYAIKDGDGSNNLVVNSSFEHLQEGLPNYMRPMLGGKYEFDGAWEDFVGAFAIDTAEKVSGKQCLRMTCGRDYPKANGVSTFNVSVMPKRPVTFSVYLKASSDDFRVTLNIWELWHRNHAEPVKVTREWARYAFTVDGPEKGVVRGNLKFRTPGTVWADDLQVEVGSETTPYQPSPLDRDKFSVAARDEPLIEPDIALPGTAAAPTVDGRLEDLWFRSAVKVDRFFLNGTDEPPNRTEAYLTCDAEHLYVAVRAHVPDTGAVKATELDHDNLKVHGEDCIEVFLDSTFSRDRYCHLTVNAAGSRTDFGPGRAKAWNGVWDAAARINAKESSIDYEMRFPLSLFADLDLAGKWGLNLGRHDTNAQKVYSLIHASQVNFHLPAIFPGLVFPDGVLDGYRLGARELRLVAGEDAGIGVAGTIGNLTGKPLDAEIRILTGTTGEVVGAQRVALAKGDTDVDLPVCTAVDTQALDATVQLLVGGKLRYSQPRRLELARPLELYTRRNYYMKETAAVLVGTLNLPDAHRLTGRVAVAGRTFDVELAREFAVEIPLDGIPNGENPLTLEVVGAGAKLATGTTTLVKREFRAGATQIDRQRRCLVVDGEPYLAITPFFGVNRGIRPEQKDTVLRNMLRRHREMGYRCLLVGAVDDDPVQKHATEFLDLCAEAGVKVIYWPFQSWRRRDQVTPEQRLRTQTSDSIIAWLVVDEPELYAKGEEVEPFMEAHRTASPYAPVFMNNTVIGIPGCFAGLKTDILMLDDYLCNRENRKVLEMLHATDMMWEAGRAERKPVFYFLEGENLSNHYRECTYAEQVAQTYGVIIAGATGVSYFCSLPFYPEDYRACVDVNRELLALEEVIFSLDKTSKATVSNSSIRFMTRKLGGRIYVIALNTDNDRAVQAEIVFPSEFRYARRAEVKFEGRELRVRKGRTRDTFEPLQRHVYVVDIKKRWGRLP